MKVLIIHIDEAEPTTELRYIRCQLASTGRDFANLEKYQNRQPSIFNLYFGINLITAVDKLPNLERPALEISEANLQ
jgi:hypothetical protein